MSKDHTERKTYRKSPGRQYGYEYDPLRSRAPQQGATPSRPGALLERPDPKRTRQLMRQSIIASKRNGDEETVARSRPSQPGHYQQEPEEVYEEEYLPSTPTLTPERHMPSRGSRGSRHGRDDEPYNRVRTRDMEITRGDELGDEFSPEMTYVDPDLGIDEARAQQASYYDDYSDEFFPEPDRQGKLTRQLSPEYPEEEDGYEYEYEEEYPSVRPTRKPRSKLSRRGLLIGAGATATGLGLAALYVNAPKIPDAVSTVTDNVEKQIQDAFNRGVTQGTEQARKEFVNALENVEGFTLDSAINAARLTRVAYDVFVSPIVKYGSAITGDFLNGMLSAFKKAREWLSGVYQDNATLAAIQKVLETWVDQAKKMPQQLDSITQADLDGAQAYLRALKRKLDDEKAKLNKPQAQSTPTAAPAKTTPTPQKK